MSNDKKEELILKSEPDELIIAGPTNPLSSRRILVLKPTKFDQEPLDLQCEWDLCNFNTKIIDHFMNHVGNHSNIPAYSFELIDEDNIVYGVFQRCCWKNCPYRTTNSEDLQRHLFLHAYHTKLKCIGTNTTKRSKLNSCKADASSRNILPDLSENLVCAWGMCSQTFINIQLYYDHIRAHCEANPKGNVKGGIRCVWDNCGNVFANITKLRDHMRSHTQEKLLACPNCGGLFSNRTRFFDHCRRQVSLEEQSYACSVCMKIFSTARLLRDHIRSHVNSHRCSYCDMTCSSPSALQSHIKYRHLNEKSFPCNKCDYAAKTQNDIHRHMRIHARPIYNCDVEGCSFQSKAESSLNNHKARIHSDSKDPKYICHLCDTDKRYYRGYYLTKHLISKHNLQWPSGHTRFRYKQHDDGLYRLLTLRYESIDVGQNEDDEEETPDNEEIGSNNGINGTINFKIEDSHAALENYEQPESDPLAINEPLTNIKSDLNQTVQIWMSKQ